jgi:diguanylate cyclase (GGDEF)-like protein
MGAPRRLHSRCRARAAAALRFTGCLPTNIRMGAEATWLCDAAGRERLLDMGGRVKPLRTMVFAVQFLALIAMAPWLGWWILGPMVVAAGAFSALEAALPRLQRPEIAYFGTWCLTQAMVAVGAALSGGPASPVLVWLAIPVGTLPGRFTARGVRAGVAVSLAFLLVSTVPVDPGLVAAEPYLVLFPAVAVVCVALLGVALMRSEVEHRSEAVVDPLTQMLNRKALATRAMELAQQAAISGEPVGVVLGDVDRFKRINDEAGHQAGDAVLRDLAYRMRKALRAYDLVYRLGGEEFLVLVPGATSREARDLAEQLRAAVAAEPVAGRRVTMSFGVAASGGRAFDLELLYARADAALYEAKRSGRNRVCGADELAVLDDVAA